MKIFIYHVVSIHLASLYIERKRKKKFVFTYLVPLGFMRKPKDKGRFAKKYSLYIVDMEQLSTITVNSNFKKSRLHCELMSLKVVSCNITFILYFTSVTFCQNDVKHVSSL